MLTASAKVAPELLLRLQAMGESPGEFNSLMLVSLSMLPIASAPDEFWLDFDRSIVEFAERYVGRPFDIAATERGILIKLGDYNQVNVNSDVKVILLRLIQEYFPDNFGLVDQSRLVRIIDLRFHMNAALKLMDRLVTSEQEAQDPEFHKMRRLQEDDIAMVVDVNKQLGPAQFSKMFVRDQKIAVIQPGQAPMAIMKEYFIGMDMLKKHVFKQVELRGSGNLFNQLTITLDQLVLGAYHILNPGGSKCSINLNVESVFTKSFQSLVENGDEGVFANIVFEFRQANILQHFDEYMVAVNLIRSRGGTVAVDAIFPDSVGVVSLSRLNANMAKVFWRPGAEQILLGFKTEIAEIQKSGTILVLARMDDEVGLNMGHELGISMFQGFYVDDLLSGKAAAD